jgi:hypothetical protein
MDTSKFLAELRAERDQINQAIAALKSLGGTATAAKSAPKVAPAAPVKTRTTVKKRVSTVAGRNRIAKAARKRWAALRNKKTALVASPAGSAPPPMSAAPEKKPVAVTKKRRAKQKAKLVKPVTSAKQDVTAQTASKSAKGNRRNLTAAARQAMSVAAKERWAKKKAAAAKTE